METRALTGGRESGTEYERKEKKGVRKRRERESGRRGKEGRRRLRGKRTIEREGGRGSERVGK